MSTIPPPLWRPRVRLGMMSAAGLLGGGLSLAGSLMGGSAAQKAAKKAGNIAASQGWSDVQLGERAYEDQQPYRDVGSASVNRLAMLLGLGSLPGVQRRYVPQNYNDPFFNETPAPYYGFGTPGGEGTLVKPGAGSGGISTSTGQQSRSAVSSDGGITPDSIRGDQQAAFDLFMSDPGYEFRQSEGAKAIERSAAARGGALSGATMKGLERFSQNTASDEYGNYINRLMSMAGFGPVAANASGQNSLGFAGLTQQARLAEGNARGSGYANAASQNNAGINNLLSLVGYNSGQGGFGSSIGNWFGGPSAGGFAGRMASF